MGAVVAERSRALLHGTGGPRFESRLGRKHFFFQQFTSHLTNDHNFEEQPGLERRSNFKGKDTLLSLSVEKKAEDSKTHEEEKEKLARCEDVDLKWEGGYEDGWLIK